MTQNSFNFFNPLSQKGLKKPNSYETGLFCPEFLKEAILLKKTQGRYFKRKKVLNCSNEEFLHKMKGQKRGKNKYFINREYLRKRKKDFLSNHTLFLFGFLLFSFPGHTSHLEERESFSTQKNLGSHFKEEQKPEKIHKSLAFPSEERIILVQGHYQDFFKDKMEALYRKRYEVFYKKLGWNLPVQGELEIDQYDTKEAVYLICEDRDYGICGGVRLLPTTGKYMTKELFSFLFKTDYEFPNDPHIWESSRLFYDIPRNSLEDRKKARLGAARLSIAITEFIITLSPKGTLSIIDSLREKWCKDMGILFNRLTLLQNLKEGQGDAVCIHSYATRDSVIQMRRRFGISGPVLWAPFPFEVPLTKEEEKFPQRSKF